MILGNLNIFKEKAGIISEDTIWCIIWKGCYLHCNESLFKCIIEFISEFESDKHLVG